MKTPAIFLAAIFGLSSFLCPAQDTDQQTNNVPSSTPYVIVNRDANSRVWQQLSYSTNRNGQLVTNVQSYAELATGLHHLVNGQWIESKEEIDLLPNGGAAATNGQHRVYFPADIYNGQIELITPDGEQLLSQPVGLNYFDGTNFVILAVLTNSIGELVSSNQIIYPDAFTGIKADLRYTYTKAGFEQDIILKEQPLTPESFGLNPDKARLEVLTEFFDSSQPAVKTGIASTIAGKVEDDSVNFGTMRMIRGKAFLLGTNSPSALVDKQWLVQSNRQFLVEAVPVDSIVSELLQLPVTPSLSKRNNHSPLYIVTNKRLLPAQRLVHSHPAKPIEMAKTDISAKGFVLDYATVNGTTGDYTFQGDTTYYISSDFEIDGTMTLEGGTVIKLNAPGYTFGGIILEGAPVNCKTGPYRPAIFTDKNDNTVGDTISGSTGSPSSFSVAMISDDRPFGDLEYIHFRYCGLWDANSIGCTIGNCQFINLTGTAIRKDYNYGEVDILENDLLSGIGTVFSTSGGVSFAASHLTVDSVNIFSDGATVDVTNSILSNVTTLYTGSPADVSGSYNGFYNSSTFGDYAITSSGNPFQTAGGGNYYYANGCIFTNAGTTNADPILLAELKTKTIYPPIVYSPMYVTNSLNLFPQAQRDTNAAPDLGYHYDPLDYMFGGAYATNITITLNPGTAVAGYATNGNYSLAINNQAQFISQGLANNLNHFVAYNTVQEQSPAGWVKPTDGLIVSSSGSGMVYNCRFTDWSVMAQDAPFINESFFSPVSMPPLVLRDCQFHGGVLQTYYPSINITNCLFERVDVEYLAGDTNVPTIRNCLFWNGTFDFDPADWNVITNVAVKDNLFDGTSIPDNSGDYGTYDGGHNAFVTNCDRLKPTSANDIILSSSPIYQVGPLGNYYQPTSSPLINAGSTNANLVGLYHFTTQTNQVKETNSIVDIGYHYVATDTNGVPLDTDGDGIPDYLEDANGDGIYDTGDLSDWTKFSTDGTGMGDGWEIQYFGHITVDPNADPDGDGISNLQEFQFGTNPIIDDSTLSGSRFNYIYDPGGWLQQVTGEHNGTVSPDNEGNIQQSSQ